MAPRAAPARPAERGTGVGQTPALADIGELAREAKTKIVDEALLGLPGELNEPVLEDRQALGKVLLRHAAAGEHTARVEIDLPHARSAVEPGALVEHTAVE